jgi:hypothetical protein
MRSTTSSPFAAERIALVATACSSVAPAASASSLKHDVAEADHGLLAREGLEVTVRLDVGDEEVEGVGAQVERGDPHRSRVPSDVGRIVPRPDRASAKWSVGRIDGRREECRDG